MLKLRLLSVLSDETYIVNRFADIFASTCKTRSTKSDASNTKKAKLKERLAKYGSHINFEEFINIEKAQKAVEKLSTGKAAGYDLLRAEFLKNCHPIVQSCLTRLFSLVTHCCRCWYPG